MKKKTTIGSVVRDIKRQTAKRYNAGEKIRIVLEVKKESWIIQLFYLFLNCRKKRKQALQECNLSGIFRFTG